MKTLMDAQREELRKLHQAEFDKAFREHVREASDKDFDKAFREHMDAYVERDFAITFASEAPWKKRHPIYSEVANA